MADKGLEAKVQTRHFHQWYCAQPVAYHVDLPPPQEDKNTFFADMVERVIRSAANQRPPVWLSTWQSALRRADSMITLSATPSAASTLASSSC